MVKFVDAQLVLDPASKIQSSELYQEYRSWCQRMTYSQQDDKQFKASMLRIEEIRDGRTKAGRHFSRGCHPTYPTSGASTIHGLRSDKTLPLH